MATIKEMALKCFPAKENFYDEICYSYRRDGYIAGANAVLEEIEKCMDNRETITDRVILIRAKIRELKSE